MAAGDIDDAEPSMPEVGEFIMIEPAVVGATMLDRLRHTLENLARSDGLARRPRNRRYHTYLLSLAYRRRRDEMPDQIRTGFNCSINTAGAKRFIRGGCCFRIEPLRV